MILARYLLAAVCARLADEGARVAIVLLALERADDAALGGLLVAALMVPHVLAAPLVGAAADRIRRRRLLYTTAFLWYGVSLAAAATLIGTSSWAAALILAVAGCLSPLLLGGLSSLLGELAPGNRARAFSLDAGTYGTAGIAGPAVAAVLAGWAGAGWALAGLGGFVVAGAALFLTLPLRGRSAPEAQPVRPIAGLMVFVRRPRLAAVTAASTFQLLGFGAMPLAAASIAAQAHRPALTGLLVSASACGGLFGSVICTRIPVVHRRPELVVLLCTAAMTVPFALAVVGWQAVLFAVAGVFSGVASVAVFTTRDREAPPGLRTQVFTLGAGFKVTAAAAGAAAGGLLASGDPAVLLIAIAACQLLGAATGGLLLIRPSASRSLTGAAQRSSS
ncbi:MFS transporter [Actinoplanes cyaneus]|uniref:MFS transporter n=1 Tax=Actinoplanes cyaneus TaxID=52696 RepID=A0A919M0T7_9ACTN|nr:MFS transporter [Actinoplanes cyaneus]MCW2140165.1 putative arabinose efflux permease, MFS family [Actinoplanes cyaneus]GID65480.1 MFS transporter [Actinoplanes cyaneus]